MVRYLVSAFDRHVQRRFVPRVLHVWSGVLAQKQLYSLNRPTEARGVWWVVRRGWSHNDLYVVQLAAARYSRVQQGEV